MHYPFNLPSPVDRIERMGPHMKKHHLANGQVIHHFTRPDVGHPHDHPWPFNSTILVGGYEEEEYILHSDGTYTLVRHIRLPEQTHHVQAKTVHRITQLLEKDCWTLISPGKKVNVPGFYKFEETGIKHRFWYERGWRLVLPSRKSLKTKAG